jgi:hypothetical protein
MGCRVLSNRIGKLMESVTVATIHHSVGVTDLFESLKGQNKELVVDFGKDGTGLAYLQIWMRQTNGGPVIRGRLHWPMSLLEKEWPDDFKAFAKELKQSPDKLRNFIMHKAQEGHFNPF